MSADREQLEPLLKAVPRQVLESDMTDAVDVEPGQHTPGGHVGHQTRYAVADW
jgi:hypothetical protein